jgi:hypothetical protein
VWNRLLFEAYAYSLPWFPPGDEAGDFLAGLLVFYPVMENQRTRCFLGLAGLCDGPFPEADHPHELDFHFNAPVLL